MTGTRRPGHNDARGALRFLTELIAWVTVPWALWPHSIAVAIGAVVVLLIGLSALFNTPGDRPGGGAPLIAVPGIVAILLVLIQLAAATAAAWVVWPWWVATLRLRQTRRHRTGDAHIRVRRPRPGTRQ